MQQQQQLPGLRLECFTSDAPGAAGLLAVLPAHSLCSLDLTVNSPVNGPAMFASLARLSSLQHLQLTCRIGNARGTRGDTFSCVSALANLSQLTEFELGGKWSAETAEASLRSLQQLLAQPLPLRVLRLGVNTELPVLDMGRLTQLTNLIVRSQLPEGSVLPQQLQQLHLIRCTNSSQLEALLPLQQLQSLDLHVGFADRDALRRLAYKTALQHLALRCDKADAAAGTAAVWVQLPQLQVLEAKWETGRAPSSEQASDIFPLLSAATSLTKLVVQPKAEYFQVAQDEFGNVFEPGMGLESVAACASLASLTGLQELHIVEGSILRPDDALALTALTNLTQLVLHDIADGVTDMTANALACSLKQLRALDLSSKHPGNRDRLGSVVCLAAIGHLSQLTSLQLKGYKGLTRQGFLLLLAAPRLRRLGVLHNDEVTQYWARAQFTAAMQQQRENRIRVV
jgi:hypothetical protein